MSFYSLDAAVVANGIGLKNKFHFPFPELQTQKTCFGTIKKCRTVYSRALQFALGSKFLGQSLTHFQENNPRRRKASVRSCHRESLGHDEGILQSWLHILFPHHFQNQKNSSI